MTNSKIHIKSSFSVIFINLPSLPLNDIENSLSKKSGRCQSSNLPLGILYISSCLKKIRHDTSVALIDYVMALKDLKKYNTVDEFIKHTALQDIPYTPDVVAFSLIFSSSFAFFKRAVPILKSLWPGSIFLVGGIHATNTHTFLLQNFPEIDYVFRGEGEKAFPVFIDKLINSQPVRIKGVFGKKDKSANRFTELCDWVDDLDTLPFPDWSLVDMHAYTTRLVGRQRYTGIKKRVGSILTSRGCPFKCTFCSAHTVHGRSLRYRSVDNILSEIKMLHDQYGITLFMPEDDLFVASEKRSLQLLASIKELDITGLEFQFPNALSVKTLSFRVAEELISTGMKIAVLAIESGSPYVQKNLIKKNCNLDKARKLVDFFKSRDILVRCYFVFGFPGETRAHMKETVGYARSLGADWCVFNIATPLVGSEMYRQFVENGCISDDEETWASVVYDKRTFDTPEINAQALNELVYRANLDVNFIHNPNKVRGQFRKAIEIYRDIRIRYPFHLAALYCMKECYEQLNMKAKAVSLEKEIHSLIETDSRAAEMFAKYGDLMPRLTIP